MGLFGGILKAVGKVAKAGLGVVTHGVSDKVLSVLKRTGQAKQAATAAEPTMQQQAVATKIGTHMRGATVTPQQAFRKAVTTYSPDRAISGGKMSTKRMPTRKSAALAALDQLDALAPHVVHTESVRMPQKRQKITARGPVAPKPKRKLTPAMAAMAEHSRQLAAEWRAGGGTAVLGPFFTWKKGR